MTSVARTACILMVLALAGCFGEDGLTVMGRREEVLKPQMPPQEVPSSSIASLTATVCSLLGVNSPETSSEPALQSVTAYAGDSSPVEKCLIFAPDAIGKHVWDTCEDELSKVLRFAPLRVALQSVVPPKTPVCFASMFTGAPPEVHGIREYTRPVLRCDTFFDALSRADRRSAIVAVEDSSIDKIFREREIGYFSEKTDSDVTRRSLEVLESGEFDVIVAYQQEYDDRLHETQPTSPECIEALRHHVESFVTLAKRARTVWSDMRHAVVFAPDHGAHTDLDTGKGDHGLDVPADMQLFHCYGVVV